MMNIFNGGSRNVHNVNCENVNFTGTMPKIFLWYVLLDSESDMVEELLLVCV